MRNCEKIAENVLNRKNEYEKQKSIRRKNIIKFSSLTAFVVLIGLIGFSLKDNKIESVRSDNVLAKGQNTVNATENAISNDEPEYYEKEETSVVNENQQEVIVDGGNYANGVTPPGNNFCIPLVPFDKSFKLTGETITEEEAEKYLNENKKRIISSLASDRVSVDSIRFSDGYRYVSYTGAEGESFKINQSNIDYLVYNGDKLVAIVTLMKYNGELSDSIAYGARWFEGYNKFLQSHKGEELVNVWALNCHIIVAPDNTCFNPMGVDVSGYVEGIENPYELYYHEYAIYVP